MTSTGTASSSDSRHPPLSLSWLVWGTGAIFYLIAFFLRAAPAVMQTELMRDFHIGAGSLGNLSAFYFYAYVLMQLPVGALTNTWGARKLLVAGAVSAALGQFLFGSTDSLWMACAGRAIIGGATAVGWLVILRLAAHWFPGRMFAGISGLGLFFGNLGALFAQVPLRIGVENFGWRGTAIVSACIVLAIGILAWLLVRNDPAEKGFLSHAPAELRKGTETSPGVLTGLGRVLAGRNTLLILLAQGGMVGPIMTFTGLWGAPYLKARFGLDPKAAASLCSLMIICWAVASPIFGNLSDRIGRRKLPYLGGSLICFAGWSAMLYLPGLGLSAFTVLAAITSFATGCVVIAFAYGRESVPPGDMGTSTATTNIGNMLGNVLLQPGIGLLLDRAWDGTLLKGAHVYNVQAFGFGFVPIVAWAGLSCISILLTSERPRSV